jgi:hypothetical protein
MTQHPRARLLDWRPLAKNSLLGFAKVQFSSGLIVGEIAVHRSGGRVWASPPARPCIENDTLVRDAKGKAKYQSLISFANHGVQASWSRQVLRALRAVHPDLFDDQDELSTYSVLGDHGLQAKTFG